MNVFDKTMGMLEKTMDMRAARHRVIASNLANEETPGYRAKEFRFLEALYTASHATPAERLMISHHTHLQPGGEAAGRVKGHVVDMPVNELPMDGNSVNLEMEMAKMSDNALNYNTAASMMSQRFRQLLSAIKDTR